MEGTALHLCKPDLKVTRTTIACVGVAAISAPLLLKSSKARLRPQCSFSLSAVLGAAVVGYLSVPEAEIVVKGHVYRPPRFP